MKYNQKAVFNLKNIILDTEIEKHLKKSEEDIENGRTKKAIDVFKELEKKYGF